jgi:hypothetical protein
VPHQVLSHTWRCPCGVEPGIRPAGEVIGIEGLGFHSLRHSYRSFR